MTNLSDLRGLDHLVIAVNDLEHTIADYRGLGFQVLPGGRHPGRTSHNALVVFEDGAYLELIAWQAPAPEERWWQLLQAHGEGLVDFALLPGDTAVAITAARARGLTTITGPLDGGRVRPDGQSLQWLTARQASHDLPFLCGDVTPRRLRVPEGAARQQANGVRGVAALRIAVQDLPVSVARYRALLGPHTPVTVLPPNPAADVQEAVFELGSTRFTLVAPTPATLPSHALRAQLDTRGEGPSQLTLAGPAGAPRRSLDTMACHGAAIDIA